jgi:hypothetical protein
VSRRARVAAAALALLAAGGASADYDPAPWLADLGEARAAFATKYANLEWLVRDREFDLEALFTDTAERVRAAGDAAAAHAAFDRLARRTADGHVRFRWPSAATTTGAIAARCVDLGYDARMVGAPIAAWLPGYVPLASAAARFPVGLVTVGGHRVGVLKIGVFTPQGYPDLCATAIAAIELPASAPCDDACSDRIERFASDRLTEDLETGLLALRAAGAQLLLVDVARNGGGSEWAEAAARMVSAHRLRSERLAFVRGEHWTRAFAARRAELAAAAAGASGAERALIAKLDAEFARAEREAQTPCDSAPLWKGEPLPCRWLGDGPHTDALLVDADLEALRGRPWAEELYAPLKFKYRAGTWRGPLIVLVDGGTGSAAEEFAAVLQDNHAAVILGAPTAGAGCGHTDGGTPTRLTNSGAILELPDCARLRADGSNEVNGIEPDVLVALREADGPRRAAGKIARRLPEAITRALRLSR